MPPNKVFKADNTLIEQLCNIASVSKVVASNLLEACDNNLEMAVNMQMEGVVTDTNGASTSSASAFDDVRAPIPQRQEVLVEGPDQLAFSFRGRNKAYRSVFDKFRDFQAEAKRQEEELMEESMSSSVNASKEVINLKRRKMKTLEDLFRPPLDLLFRGTFQAARDAGIGTKKWLMVNIQNSSEFPCQVLNRDVWSNAAVKTIVEEHFIFWQIYHDSEEGQRYMNFYPVKEWPYVAVIDPRTGECLVHWQRLDAVAFCELVTEFLCGQHSLDDSFGSSSAVNVIESPPKKKSKTKEGSNIIEADEQAQIEAAIKASLENTRSAKEEDETVKTEANGENDEEEESDCLETFDSDSDDSTHMVKPDLDSRTVNSEVSDSSEEHQEESLRTSEENNDETLNGEIEDSDNCDILSSSDSFSGKESELISNQDSGWKSYLGGQNEPKSKLILRLPDGTRDSVVMPSSSKLMALVLYVASKGFSNESYELVTNFPKKQLSYLDFNSTLKMVGLYPQETVFVQKR